MRSWSHVPRGLLHPTRKAAPRGHQWWDPFHVPHDPCAALPLTLPSSTGSHTHQTCNNFALLRHFARWKMKTSWVRWYCGWQDAISPPRKQILYRSTDTVGLLVLSRIRLGKAALSRRHYSQCQPCNTDILGNTCVVTHGTVGLTNSCHIASLYSASQFWQVKPPVLPIQEVPQIYYKLPCKTNMFPSLP